MIAASDVRNISIECGEPPVRPGAARRDRSGPARFAMVLLVVAGFTRVGTVRANDHEPRVTVDNAGSICRVVGEFGVPVPDSIAWSVLTDYAHISRFVHSMRSSTVERREGDRLLVRQEAVGGVLFFRRRVRVLLEIHEEAGRRISFHDVSGQDFHSYSGVWRIARVGSGTRVDYELATDPRASLPKSMYRGILRNMVQDLLDQVRSEMLRRSGALGAAGPGGPAPHVSVADRSRGTMASSP